MCSFWAIPNYFEVTEIVFLSLFHHDLFDTLSQVELYGKPFPQNLVRGST